MLVVPFTNSYLEDVYSIQQQAYRPLFEKYQDTETNPYLESKEQVAKKYGKLGTYGYVFLENDIPVGSVRIVSKGNVRKVSALAVLPDYQNRGIAQRALKEIERRHRESKIWVLDTLMQEAGNCHLYEKIGYRRTGTPVVVNEKLTLVRYIKQR